MAFERNEIFSPYERFSARVPYLPQVIVLAVLGAASLYLSVYSYTAFLRYLEGALSVNFITQWDWAGMTQEPFASAFWNLMFHMVGLVVIAIVMRSMPLFHEANRTRATTGAGRFFEALSGISAGIVVFGYAIAFVLWSIFMAVFMFIPAIFGTLFNYILMPPAILLMIGVHGFVIYSIGKMTFMHHDYR